MFVYSDQFSYTKAYDYDANGNLLYEGWATPGSDKSAPKWRIKKVTWIQISSGWLTNTWETSDEQYASDCTATNIWNNRASYTYS